MDDPLPTLADNLKPEQPTTTPTISKKQLKRLAKHERWVAGKADRRKREKAKRKEKRAQVWQSGEPPEPHLILSRKQRREQLVRQADSPCKVAVVVDCDYGDYMNEAELKKLCKQMNW